jgi:hypothetical protein
MFRFMVIARVLSLAQLNGAMVRTQERVDSERFYLRSNLDNEHERTSDLWTHLVAKHGDPAEIGRLVSSAEALAGQTVTSSTASVLIRSLTASSAGQEARKRLSLTLKVGDLKNMCRKLFRLSTDFKLTYRESPSAFAAPMVGARSDWGIPFLLVVALYSISPCSSQGALLGLYGV